MRCKLCKGKTTWDTSVGRESFIVCNDCWHELANLTGLTLFEVVSITLEMGNIKEERNLYKRNRKKFKSSCNLRVDSNDEK